MRLSILFLNAVAILIGAALCSIAAGYAVSVLEDGSEIGVRRALDDASLDWAEVEADGLRVILSGTAPDEASRFAAISTTGGVVDAARIIDEMQIAPNKGFAAPRFSAEILRNDSGISIIGLIPADTDRAALVRQLERIAGPGQVADLLETAHYAVPEGWEDALGFAVTALDRLPRSKVSVDAGQVSITAITDSPEERRTLEAELNRAAPPGLPVALNLSAPRPVITPFTVRYTIDGTGGHFDACSAESEDSRDRILDVARDIGLSGPASCTIGMGVPSPRWADAVEAGLRALAELGQGTLTIADADVSLVAAEGTDPALFDRVAGELDAALPEVFALNAALPVPEDDDGEGGPREFTATLSPEGLVQLRGRLSDENLRHMADSYARARFGTESVYMAARVVDGLPVDWPVRVLAGLEALSLLSNGVLTVTPESLDLAGVTEREDGSARISGLLADKLGSGATFTLDITYRPPPEPEDTAPDPDTCEADLARAQDGGKITFEPGSATVRSDSFEILDRIAEILNDCGDIRLEIQGHTDSQGRESMNQQLSQARAQSVLNELRARRVLTSTYVAVGYGETRPIADNDTEEGREANRRIEFRLIRPITPEDAETTLESAARDLTAAAAADAEEGLTTQAGDTAPEKDAAEDDGNPAAPDADAAPDGNAGETDNEQN